MNRDMELMTNNQILAEGWRLTKEIFRLQGMKIPDTITFQIEGNNRIKATRVAKPEELAKAIVALDEAIEHRNEDEPYGTAAPASLETEELNKQRRALVELQ